MVLVLLAVAEVFTNQGTFHAATFQVLLHVQAAHTMCTTRKPYFLDSSIQYIMQVCVKLTSLLPNPSQDE